MNKLKITTEDVYNANKIYKQIFKKLTKIKDNLRLNLCLSTFENQCYEINEILTEKNLFLRVYEKCNKFHYLIRKSPTGKYSFLRDLSCCVIERYNRYQVVKIKKKGCQKYYFEPIDIAEDPVEGPDQIFERYYTKKVHFAYHHKWSKGKKGIETFHAFECYGCHKFHSTKKKFEKHLSVCTQTGRIAYKFDSKSLVSFENNYRFLGDLPFVVYLDFETTAGNDIFMEKKCMLSVIA